MNLATLGAYRSAVRGKGIEFQEIREYVPGDDRRHVHWRTSARIGSLRVRQYVDPRRSHLAVVLSTAIGEFTNDEEFELAVSIAGATMGSLAGSFNSWSPTAT